MSFFGKLDVRTFTQTPVLLPVLSSGEPQLSGGGSDSAYFIRDSSSRETFTTPW